MRRFLLATAAVAALALAAPMAGAQNTDTTGNPAYSTPSDPAMQDEQIAAPNATPPIDAETSAAPATTTTPFAQAESAAPAQPSTLDTAHAQQAQAQPAQTEDQYATTPSSDAYADTANTSDQYASVQSTGADQTMSATMVEYAQDAGMAGVPMSAAEVCAPRDVSLAQGTSRLNSATRQQLRFAADRASACDLQRVVVTAPDGRASAAVQTLVEHGVDQSMIEVQQASELGVEMTFAGVATSNDQYAAIFNGQQFAAAEATTQPSSATTNATTSGYQQTNYSPNTAPAYSTSTSYAPATAPAADDHAGHDMDEEMNTEEPIN